MSRALLVLAVLSAVACGTSCSSRESESPTAPIAFQRGQELMLIDPDGSNERTLADFRGELARDWELSWSPNGRQILVSDHYDRWVDIHVVEADGSGRRKLWRARDITGHPHWSPLGDAILIDDVGDPNVYRHAIWVITLDGKARRMPLGKAFGHPMWSPDGTKIAYDGPDAPSFLADPWIYVMNADGSARKRITKGRAPSWAPGKRIRFMVGEDLWVVNPDGSGRRRATEVEELLEFGVVSPNGRMVAEEHGPTWRHDLYVKDLIGDETQKLTGSVDVCCADWSPDSKSLAFLGYARTGPGYRPGDIYVINADGTGERNLTDSPENESWPVWSPRR